MQATPAAKTVETNYQQFNLFQLVLILPILLFHLAYVQNYANVNEPRGAIDSETQSGNLSEPLQINAVSNESVTSPKLDVTLTCATYVPFTPSRRNSKPVCDNRLLGEPINSV